LIDRSDRIAVVGAGPGGVCAARWLQDLGVTFDLLERNPDVGGIWDIAFPGSPMYESAHFISSRTLSGFRDFPMPATLPDYPSHRQVLAYLRAYADRHGLRGKAEFGVGVRRARPEGDASWVLELETGETRRYAGLVAATGLQWLPQRPELPGRFEGEAYHSSAYRSARQVEGRRVLVVGGGNSGCDIAVDAASRAAATFLSLRRGYWIVPKHVFGVPADVFGRSAPPLPYWLERALLERLLRLLVGDVRRLGLPAPDHRLFQTHPILNSQILHALSHGDVAVRPDLERLEGREAVFAGGRHEAVDVVILATGYRRRIPILPPDVHREGDTASLFLNAFHRRHRNLFVVGFFETDGGAYPLVDLQCELIARVIRARRDGGSSAFERRLPETPDFSGGVGFLDVERMRNYLRTRPYARYLRARLRELGGGEC
jgi:cation diffusion facilitator CzcD-associated flavoprotein CzcO